MTLPFNCKTYLTLSTCWCHNLFIHGVNFLLQAISSVVSVYFTLNEISVSPPLIVSYRHLRFTTVSNFLRIQTVFWSRSDDKSRSSSRTTDSSVISRFHQTYTELVGRKITHLLYDLHRGNLNRIALIRFTPLVVSMTSFEVKAVTSQNLLVTSFPISFMMVNKGTKCYFSRDRRGAKPYSIY